MGERVLREGMSFVPSGLLSPGYMHEDEKRGRVSGVLSESLPLLAQEDP